MLSTPEDQHHEDQPAGNSSQTSSTPASVAVELVLDFQSVIDQTVHKFTLNLKQELCARIILTHFHQTKLGELTSYCSQPLPVLTVFLFLYMYIRHGTTTAVI